MSTLPSTNGTGSQLTSSTSSTGTNAESPDESDPVLTALGQLLLYQLALFDNVPKATSADTLQVVLRLLHMCSAAANFPTTDQTESSVPWKSLQHSIQEITRCLQNGGDKIQLDLEFVFLFLDMEEVDLSNREELREHLKEFLFDCFEAAYNAVPTEDGANLNSGRGAPATWMNQLKQWSKKHWQGLAVGYAAASTAMDPDKMITLATSLTNFQTARSNAAAAVDNASAAKANVDAANLKVQAQHLKLQSEQMKYNTAMLQSSQSSQSNPPFREPDTVSYSSSNSSSIATSGPPSTHISQQTSFPFTGQKLGESAMKLLEKSWSMEW